MRAFACVLLIAIGAAAAPKHSPQGQGDDASVSLTATILSPEELRDAVGSDFDGNYTVLEVKVTPKGDKPYQVHLEDFILRSEQTGEHGGPFINAGQIAGAGAMVLERKYANRQSPGSPRMIQGSKLEMKDDSAADPAHDAIKKKMLQEQSVTAPASGLLFFPLSKEKTKKPGSELQNSLEPPPPQLQVMNVSELDTPAILVDLDVMERNLSRVADYSRQHGLRLRPHTKTHKSTKLARRQIELGAAGLTVAKVGEAEVMLGAHPQDLLVAFPVVTRSKLARLSAIAKKVMVTVALDSLAAAKLLSEAAVEHGAELGVLLEIDVGLGRVGVKPSEAIDLARAVSALPAVRFRGITFYPGHIREQNEMAIAALSATVGDLTRRFQSAGLPTEIVSGGSTPLLYRSHDIDGLNEIRPGTYLFNDMNTVASGGCALEDCAASIVATVVSHHAGDRMIIDGGSKTFSSDRDGTGSSTFGRIVEAPTAVFGRMNEEHGFIDLRGVDESFEVGSRVRIIPNHICVAVNLHEFVYGIRGDKVEEVWKVEARGKLQ